jgi:hypothetical protein
MSWRKPSDLLNYFVTDNIYMFSVFYLEALPTDERTKPT